MDQSTLTALSGWANFYVIVGSSAGALTGLQFVVMTLITEARAEGSRREVRAFGSPTVVQFCAALLISAAMSVPWQSLQHLGLLFGGCGVAGLVYGCSTIWHASKTTYRPDIEDWIWYTALPLVNYTALLAAGILLWWNPILSMFVTAATTLLFLFVGIRNSWDTVTYIALQQKKVS